MNWLHALKEKPGDPNVLADLWRWQTAATRIFRCNKFQTYKDSKVFI